MDGHLPAADAVAYYMHTGELRFDDEARCMLAADADLNSIVSDIRTLSLTMAAQCERGRAMPMVRNWSTHIAHYRAHLSCVEQALLGSEAAVVVMLHRHGQETQHLASLRKRFGLTPREADVARLLIARHGNAEIAQHLGISQHTARHHVQKLLGKLGVSSRRLARDILSRTSTSLV